MSTLHWQGGAPEVAQVIDYLFGGTWEASDLVSVTMGDVTVSLGAVGSTSITTLLDTLVTAYNNLDEDSYPQFTSDESGATASRSGNNFRLTANAPGVPIECTLTTVDAGGAADAQTIDGAASSAGTITTANSGPNDWRSTGNWDTGAIPVNSDTVIFDARTTDPALYGLDQNGVTLAALRFLKGCPRVGLPTFNVLTPDSPYAEHRPDHLKINPTILYIEDGDRIKVNGGSTAWTATIVDTATGGAESGVPCVLLLGTHASNSLTVQRGLVGVGFYGEASNLTGLCAIGKGAATNTTTQTPVVTLGNNVTLGTVTIDSGTLISNSAMTALNQNGGLVQHYQGAITTIVSWGTLYYLSTSAITTCTINDSVAVINAAITTCNVNGTGANVRLIGQPTTLNANAGTVFIEATGTTVTGTSVAANVVSNGKVTNLTVHGGIWEHLAGGCDALIMDGGTLYYDSIGTLDGNPVVANDGVLDFSRTSATKRVNNAISVYGSSWKIKDIGTVTNDGSTRTLAINAKYGKIGFDNFDPGTNVKVTCVVAT